MKAKKDIREGFQTRAHELLDGSEIINFRVDFHAGSYIYRDSKFFSIESFSDFQDLQVLVASLLRSDKNQSTPKETFWATFTPELQEADSEEYAYTKYDLFKERVKVLQR